MNYRQHRGTFQDSIATRRKIESFGLLLNEISVLSHSDSITITRYGWDARLQSDTFIVTTPKGVVGFIDDGKI